MNPTVIILIGLPGSGKGTHSSYLSHTLDALHISTGDILREMSLKNNKDSMLLKSFIDNGKLIPSDLVNRIVLDFFSNCNLNENKTFILDGYPRTIDQAKYLEDNLNMNLKVLFFDVDEQVAISRVLSRFSCVSCGAIFSKLSHDINTHICHKCGSKKFDIRSDDNKEIISSRIENYKSDTLPLVNFYTNKGLLYRIDANQDRDKIIDNLKSITKMI